MFSEDPLASAAEGATKGALEYAEDKIKELVAKFLNRDIAFVQDPEIINVAKEQRKTSEWNLFKVYVDDPDLHILFQLGLTLRKLEGQQSKIIALRNKILGKYDTRGLHIAQFIQNGFFGKFLGNILERTSTPEALRFEIKAFFDNIENTVVFVKESDDATKKTEEVTAKILAHSPRTFLICSSGSATEKCRQIKERVMRRISGYTTELYQATYKEIYFINRSQESPK